MKTCLCNDQRRSGQLFSHDANINIVLFSDVNATIFSVELCGIIEFNPAIPLAVT